MEKIKRLKKILKNEKLDGYIIPKNDEFYGEYIANKKDRLKFISDFTGSYGFALILNNKNYLFVDGRYTLQANKQSASSFEIKTIPQELPSDILKNKHFKIGFDPKLFTKKTLKLFFGKTKCTYVPLRKNLVDEVWKRKKNTVSGKFYKLSNNFVGENYKSKIKKITSRIKKMGADFQFVSASENNAWLLNIRGSDSLYTPIPNSYTLIDQKKNVSFFCDLKKIPSYFKKNFNNINFIDINYTSKILSEIKKKKFIIDSNTCSIFFENIILKNNKVLNQQDPIYFLKAIKTSLEITNVKNAHIIDGVALTKYLFWLKKNFINKKITEISAAQKLLSFRKQNKNFKSLSFPTISGTGPNGAIIHYKATKKSNRRLKKGDIYLVDSGGQYNYGTTDVTRTISLHNSNKRIKNIFTRVLKGHIAVASFNLKKNTSGSTIDYVARKYLRQINLDYAHGTGHGVGYYLNVHEGPHAISKGNTVSFKEGMIVSNEPGYYEKNNFGIRIENLVYVKNNKFNNLTMAPIDKSLIDVQILNNKEKKWINNYHKKVHDNLKKFMSKKEISELKSACSAI
ncbi:aminopeptidase P family protein [Candidatus Pelagibacter bacterium]|nr:aminopeptidase P family protein [Candidatus Pelagibacter bacterium]